MISSVTRFKGFSLIELMVVISIVAIMAALAAPGFSSLIADQRVKVTAGELHSSLLRARSEAMKRGTNVTLSPKSSSWANGWQIVNPTTSTDVLDDHGFIAGITISGGPTNVVYSPSGRLSAGTSSTFTVATPSSNTKRCVSVDLTGRPGVKSC